LKNINLHVGEDNVILESSVAQISNCTIVQKCDDFIAVRNHLPDWLRRRIVGDIKLSSTVSGIKVMPSQGMCCRIFCDILSYNIH